MSGTFPAQAIEALVARGAIRSAAGIRPEQVQPASLDLTLSAEAYSVPGSMLPLPGEEVRALVERFARRRLDLRTPQILVRGEVQGKVTRQTLLRDRYLVRHGLERGTSTTDTTTP